MVTYEEMFLSFWVNNKLCVKFGQNFWIKVEKISTHLPTAVRSILSSNRAMATIMSTSLLDSRHLCNQPSIREAVLGISILVDLVGKNGKIFIFIFNKSKNFLGRRIQWDWYQISTKREDFHYILYNVFHWKRICEFKRTLILQ